MLRWFKDATKLRLLALDAGIGIATACRYLHEAIDVIAAHAMRRVNLSARNSVVGAAPSLYRGPRP